MKFRFFLLFLNLLFLSYRIDAQEIVIVTTSNNISWSPVRVTNSGSQLVWVAESNQIGTLTENTNDPTFNFGLNNGNDSIIITITGTVGFTGLSNLRIISSSIQEIDLQNTTALTNLFLTGNNISTIDISNNNLLTRLLLANNNLSTLSVSNNIIIKDLRINNNSLPSNVLDAIVNNLDSFGTSEGILRIANNTGSLTSSSKVAFDNLIAKGWVIDVDSPPSIPNDQQPPGAVTDLISSNTTVSTTDLSWTATTDDVGVTDYEIYQDGSSLGLIGGLTSFNVTELLPSSNYAFTVFAKDAAGNTSAVSNTENISTLDDTIDPSPITDLVASNTTSATIDLSWSASTDNVEVTDYEVYQDDTSLGFTGGLTMFSINDLSPLTNYTFTVFANDNAGNSSSTSDILNVTTFAIPDIEEPLAITDLSSSNTTVSTTDLSWTATTDNVGVTDYEVYQDGSSLGLTGGLSTFNVTVLLPSSNYAFTVFAKDAAGNTSGVSNIENVTTLDDIIGPSAITDLAAFNTMTKTTDLSWTAATDNVGVTDYEVFQDGSSLGFTGGATSFNVIGLATNTSYVFTVFSKDEVGNVSNISNVVDITTLTAIDYTSDNANISTVDWEARDLYANRNVGIGTANTDGYRLAVAGNIVAEEIKVALQVNWPDFVFDKSYELPSLEEIETYIEMNGHLMNMPRAKDVKENGIKLGEMNAKLLQKIEELTLFTIQQEKEIKNLELFYKRLELLLEKVIMNSKEKKVQNK